jgi:hypothetical protein
MAKSYFQHHHHNAHQLQNKEKTSKHLVKLLADCKSNPRLFKLLLQSAPDQSIKTICNAALNLSCNPSVKIPQKIKRKLRTHKKIISKLISKNISVSKKRELLTRQHGGAFPLLATLIPAAISFLGSALFSKQ